MQRGVPPKTAPARQLAPLARRPPSRAQTAPAAVQLWTPSHAAEAASLSRVERAKAFMKQVLPPRPALNGDPQAAVRVQRSRAQRETQQLSARTTARSTQRTHRPGTPCTDR